MANDPLFLIAALACFIVLAILITGVAGFSRGGEFNRKHGNRLMRWRLIAQAVAVALILLFIAVRGGTGN